MRSSTLTWLLHFVFPLSSMSTSVCFFLALTLIGAFFDWTKRKCATHRVLIVLLLISTSFVFFLSPPSLHFVRWRPCFPCLPFSLWEYLYGQQAECFLVIHRLVPYLTYLAECYQWAPGNSLNEKMLGEILSCYQPVMSFEVHWTDIVYNSWIWTPFNSSSSNSSNLNVQICSLYH